MYHRNALRGQTFLWGSDLGKVLARDGIVIAGKTSPGRWFLATKSGRVLNDTESEAHLMDL